MGDDYYRFIDQQHTLQGENTKKVYKLGDQVLVQVVRVDMERRQVDLGTGGDSRGRAPRESSRAARQKQGGIKAGTAPYTAPGVARNVRPQEESRTPVDVLARRCEAPPR
jgi:ribonuclease R